MMTDEEKQRIKKLYEDTEAAWHESERVRMACAPSGLGMLYELNRLGIEAEARERAET